MLFSNSTYSEFNPPPENNFAHVYTDSIITDTTNWFTIAGSFVADSTYSNIILGIFFDNNNVDTLRLFKPNCDVFAYYFIDDVCVSSDSLTCVNPVSIIEPVIDNDSFNIYPNPATDFFSINNASNQPYNLTIYNSIGQLLFEETSITNNSKKINITNFNSNLLFIKIKTENNSFTYKLLKP